MIMWVAMVTAAITALVVIPAFLPRDGVAAGSQEPVGSGVVSIES